MLMVIDATEGVTEQDAKRLRELLMNAEKGGSSVVNKWDAIEKRQNDA